MKYVILLLAVSVFMSCGNKKAELVNKQKRLHSDIAYSKNKIEFLENEIMKVTMVDPAFDSLIKVKAKLELESAHLQFVYDSIEWELKKY